MTAPYLLVSDMHAHGWSQFSTTDADGVNSRLRIILNELDRAAHVLKGEGGDTIVFAGDLFHSRGSIDPEVFNPVHKAIENLCLRGFRIYAIPGNHDLKSKETTELGNAFQSLAAIDGFTVITTPAVTSGGLAFIPWASTHAELFAGIDKIRNVPPSVTAERDLIIHAGIDGVLSGVPASGLTAEKLAAFGFKRVFAGHYHNHVDLGHNVYSIGATTHQTYSDIGTKAGFLLVYPDRVKFHASHAPSFIEVTGEDDEDEIPLMVDGNYVRVRSMKLNDAEIQKFRKSLLGMGAKGVSFQIAREVVSARTGAPAKASTLDESVDQFVDTLSHPEPAKVKAHCVDILNTVRSVTA